jgi:hypothetical protein
MRGCLVCEVFPGHRGPHYTTRDVETQLFAMRRRTQGFGPAQWQRLPGSFAASTRKPLLVSIQVSDHPDSRRVGGVWLRADHGTLVAETSNSAHPVETHFAPVARAPVAALEASRRTFLGTRTETAATRGAVDFGETPLPTPRNAERPRGVGAFRPYSVGCRRKRR